MERNKQNLRQKTSIKRIYDPVKKKDREKKDRDSRTIQKKSGRDISRQRNHVHRTRKQRQYLVLPNIYSPTKHFEIEQI